MGENFVLDDGGVIVDEDELDCEGGDLGEENTAEGVGKGGVDADEGEGGVMGVIFVDGDVEVLVGGEEVSSMGDGGLRMGHLIIGALNIHLRTFSSSRSGLRRGNGRGSRWK